MSDAANGAQVELFMERFPVTAKTLTPLMESGTRRRSLPTGAHEAAKVRVAGVESAVASADAVIRRPRAGDGVAGAVAIAGALR